jgi:hypothetical protein
MEIRVEGHRLTRQERLEVRRRIRRVSRSSNQQQPSVCTTKTAQERWRRWATSQGAPQVAVIAGGARGDLSRPSGRRLVACDCVPA